MSYILHDPDEWKAVIEGTPCPCKGKCNGHCMGSLSYSLQRRSPEEIARIKADKQRAHEDAVLAEADAIRRRRSA